MHVEADDRRELQWPTATSSSGTRIGSQLGLVVGPDLDQRDDGEDDADDDVRPWARMGVLEPCSPLVGQMVLGVLMRPPLVGDEIDEREDQDPHDVDEVPVQPGDLDQ